MTEKPRTIFRVKHDPDNPYVIMDKRPLEKPYLSWRAKGMLSYLLSRPDDWIVRLGDLIKRSTDGPFATRQALRELIKVGHARKVEARNSDGTYGGVIYEIYEQPLIENRQAVPNVENPQADRPQAVERVINNTESLPSIEFDEDDGALAELSSLYQENIGVITSLTADLLRNASIDYPRDWYKPAFEIAVKNNVRKWNYVETILSGWKSNGFGWRPERLDGKQRGRAKIGGKSYRQVDVEEKIRRFVEG